MIKKNRFLRFHATLAQWSWKQDGVFHFRLEIVILECNETRGASYNHYDKRCADKFEENSCIYGKTIALFCKVIIF